MNILGKIESYTKTDMKYIGSGLLWIMGGKIVAFFFSFILMLAFANLTTKETYGSYQFILTIIGIGSIASLPGINISLIRSIAKGKDGTLSFLLKKRLAWSIIGTITILLVSIWFLFFEKNLSIGISLIIAAIFLPFFSSYDVYESYWNGKKNFKITNIYNTLSIVIPSILSILTVLFYKNLVLIVFVFLLSNTLVRYLLTKLTIKKISNEDIDMDGLSMGKILTISQGVEILSNYIDKIIIWKFLGPIQLAIYSFSQTPISKILQLTPIQVLSLPKLSEQNIFDNKKVIIEKFLKLFIIMIPASIIFIFISPFLYKLFFPQYYDSVQYVKILGILISFMPFAFLNSALIASASKKEISIIQIFSFIIKIILFIVLVPLLGIWGIVYPTLFTEILKGVLTFYFFLKIKNQQKIP